MIRLNKPKLNGTKDYEKIEELRRYLFSLTEDLQFILGELDTRLHNVETAAASVTTADYSISTPDAMAYDGMAYEGDMPEIEENMEVQDGELQEI